MTANGRDRLSSASGRFVELKVGTDATNQTVYPFSPGDPTLRLNSGQGSPFGPVSSTTPIRVTVYHPASLVGGAVVDPTMTATFNVVSLSGDNLGGLTFQRGNSTQLAPAIKR